MGLATKIWLTVVCWSEFLNNQRPFPEQIDVYQNRFSIVHGDYISFCQQNILTAIIPVQKLGNIHFFDTKKYYEVGRDVHDNDDGRCTA